MGMSMGMGGRGGRGHRGRGRHHGLQCRINRTPLGAGVAGVVFSL